MGLKPYTTFLNPQPKGQRQIDAVYKLQHLPKAPELYAPSAEDQLHLLEGHFVLPLLEVVHPCEVHDALTIRKLVSHGAG